MSDNNNFATEQHKELHKELHREYYLTCEKYYIFELLTIAGGMMGLYTYNLRGGVFSNAQTGNIVKWPLHSEAVTSGLLCITLYRLRHIFWGR